MKVDKLMASNQNEDWFEKITAECKSEYPMYMMDELTADDLVIDAGCNVGGFREAFKDRFNNFIAIDASSYNVEEYQKHFPNSNPINKALYSADGRTVKLRKFMLGDNDTNSGNFGISGTEFAGNGWIGDEFEEVETLSLETILTGVDEVGLLKIDIEGAEYDFLYGKDLSKIKYITGEFHNFLFDFDYTWPGSDRKGDELLHWIKRTHEEVYTAGNGMDSHYVKVFKRK